MFCLKPAHTDSKWNLTAFEDIRDRISLPQSDGEDT